MQPRVGRRPVLIVAPHSDCRGGERCDRTARAAAIGLFGHLISQSSLLLPLTARSQGDLNRPETRTWPYRTMLRELLPDYRLVLDVHSYTPGSGPIGSLAAGAGLVVLDTGTALARAVYQDLARRFPGLVLLVASPVGDLRRDVAEHGGICLSFELNNDLDSALREQLLRAIVVFVRGWT